MTATPTRPNIIPEYYTDSVTGQKYMYVKVGGAYLAAIWTGSGTSGAPDAESYNLGEVGADLDGIATGVTYHVVGAVGSKAWVPTGATVKNLYGGA